MTQTPRQESGNDLPSAVPAAAISREGESVPRRILIVEDNEVARRQLQQLLQQAKAAKG